MKPITFHKALDNLSQAHDAAVAAMLRDFPFGTVVTYRQGIRQIAAEVVEFGWGLRLKVRGVNSGKEYWLDPRRITSSL